MTGINLKGLNITSTIVPTNSADTFATHDSIYGKGGWREVNTIAERDAIPEDRRREGMIVYVRETFRNYQLQSTLSNAGWTVFPATTDVADIINDAINKGQINIDLTAYYNKGEMDTLLNEYTKREEVSNALATVADAESKIDYVVDTASVLYKQPLAHMDYNEIDESINVNYRGMVNVAKEAFQYLKETKGQLLFYTSSSYTRGRMDYSIYSSTKCATVNFVQALAEEWGQFYIRVNCINPERTKTPMRIKNFGVEPEETLLHAEDVAGVSAKVLVSELTGQVFDVKVMNV